MNHNHKIFYRNYADLKEPAVQSLATTAAEAGREVATDSDSDDDWQADHPEYFGRGWRPAPPPATGATAAAAATTTPAITAAATQAASAAEDATSSRTPDRPPGVKAGLPASFPTVSVMTF